VSRTAQPDGGKRQLRILLAEDNNTNKLIAVMTLEKAGHVVEVVENGRKAIEALERETFDLILMDVYMPEMDGLEATRIIRARAAESGRHIPIIAMTATDTQEHRQCCKEAGMVGFISKPVKLDELNTVIATLLPDVSEVNGRPAPPVNLAAALEVVDGDLELLRDVVQMFSEEYRAQVRPLAEAVAQQDALTVESAAHKLSRVLGNVGGLAARDVAQRLKVMGETARLDGGEDLLAQLEEEIERIVTFFSAPNWERAFECQEE